MAKLFMLLIGSLPEGRHIEQHDVFFGIGNSIRDVLPHAMNFWPEAKNSFHLDAWRAVTKVDDFIIEVVEQPGVSSATQLFFINLGGYKQNEFEEFHYKMLAAAVDKNEAIKRSKQTAFFKHTGFKGANAHIDDKYGIDVDDCFAIREILPAEVKNKYSIVLHEATKESNEDDLHLGYFRPDKIDSLSPADI